MLSGNLFSNIILIENRKYKTLYKYFNYTNPIKHITT